MSTWTVLAPLRMRFVTSKRCAMNMLSASPTFSPFRNTSANVSMPSNTSSTRPAPGVRVKSNVLVYSHSVPSHSRIRRAFIPTAGSGSAPARTRSSSQLPGTVALTDLTSVPAGTAAARRAPSGDCAQ